jgi:phage gpG-like protein
MLTIALAGVEAFDAALAAYPQAVAEALAAKADALAAALADKIRNEKLAGEVLQSRSGALAASIAAEVAADGENIVATIGSSGVKYAAIQEYGGRTSAHEILPSKATALAFVIDGAVRFARRVEHPGSTIPERSYLRSSLEEMSDQIFAEFSSAAAESWGNS